MPSLAERLDYYLIKYLAYFNYRDYVSRMSLQGNERVLEIGCCGGNLTRFLAEELSLGELVCIDNSKYWINKTIKELKDYENIEFNVEDILKFDRENYFDAVVIHYVLHDILEEERVIDVLKHDLKQEGRIYIREPTRRNHGMPSEEIRLLMKQKGFLEKFSREDHSFPLKGKFTKEFFKKCPNKNKRNICESESEPFIYDCLHF